MDWFNYHGLAIVIILLIPNIVFAIKNKNGSNYKNKLVEVIEQIGRFGCLLFMVFNIPYTYFNFWFDNALIVYLSVNAFLILMYCILWIIYCNKNNKIKALSLSIIPTLIFLFSGVVLAYIPLIAFAILFGFSHIYISYKNATNLVV